MSMLFCSSHDACQSHVQIFISILYLIVATIRKAFSLEAPHKSDCSLSLFSIVLWLSSLFYSSSVEIYSA